MTGMRLHQSWLVAKRTNLIHARSIAALCGYYCLTLFSALCDGLGLVLLVSLVTGKLGPDQTDTVSLFVINTLKYINVDGSKPAALLTVALLFAVKTVILMGLTVVEAMFTASIRRKLQESAYASALNADWEIMRAERTGQLVGQLTEESHLVTRYFMSVIKAVYYAIASVVFGLLAIAVSLQLTLLMAVLGAPLVYGLRRAIIYQSRVSAMQTQARQGFAADIAERLNNLFFIKTQGSEARHINIGNRQQPEIARFEILVGYCQALITNFNAVLISLALVGLYFWVVYSGQPFQNALHLLATVGAIGARGAAQFNNTVASVGTISRFSGSIPVLSHILGLKAATLRNEIAEPIVSVFLNNVGYRIDDRVLVPCVNAIASVGTPLTIRGPSGSGKTTTANLIAGIFSPSSGAVEYMGVSGRKYDATQFKARIGYVTQDIVTFHGTVRDNLMPSDGRSTDDEFWLILSQVGASQFIRAAGGLDAVMAEAGRSLSGGERRRLGIARALTCQADIIILDEISNGLDDQLRDEIATLINEIAKSKIIIAITHEPTEFQDWNTLRTFSCPQ